MNVASLGHALIWASNLPTLSFQVLFWLMFPYCTSVGWLPCLPSKSSLNASKFSSSQAHWSLELQALCPVGYSNSQNLAPFTFQDNCYGDTSSQYTPLCVSLSLAFLHDHDNLPLQRPYSLFLSNSISTLPTFFHVVFSLPLVVKFVLWVFRSIYGLFRMIW